MLAMTDRIRITFDVPDRVRRALNICAARRDLSVGGVIQELVELVLTDDLATADKTIAEGQGPSRPRRGRGQKGGAE
jgi:hypothetical protein